MTAIELKEFENLENLQALFRDPEAQERLSDLGVRTALVASWDGLLIDSVVCDDEPVELEMLAANAAAALQLSHADKRPSRVHVDGVLAEFDNGSTVIIDPVGDNTLVAFVTKPASDINQLRAKLRNLAQIQVAGALSPVAETETLDSIAATPAQAHVAAPKPAPTPAPARRTQAQPPATPPARFGPRTPAPAAEAHRAPAPQHPEPTLRPAPIHHPAPATVQDIVRSTPAGRRVILKKATLDVSGFVATARVELSLNGQKVMGKAVSRNDSDQHLLVAAEAALRAVTQLLPNGYGVVLEHITPVASEVDQTIRAVSVKVLFLTPSGAQTLLGIAKVSGDEPVAAAKTVLSAVNSSLEQVLAQAADQIH
jgi:predicted regulator of Ras-like GTPase activity (Roadblock/LC7/MglB family)